MPGRKTSKKQAAGNTETKIPNLDAEQLTVRPRFGNKFCRFNRGSRQGEQEGLDYVTLRSIFSDVGNKDAQANALEQMGIQLSRNDARLDLQEFRPGSRQRLRRLQRQDRKQKPTDDADSMRLQTVLSFDHTVKQPLSIYVRNLNDFYIESDIAFFCLLEATSSYGESYSIPVLGRGSFSCLGDSSARPGAPADVEKREHCVSGSSAGFLQRAALSLTVLICLCELSYDAQDIVVDFYRRVDKVFGYGYGPYLDYLVYCCRTATQHRNSYLKYLCLEFNNPSTQDRMTEALSHFIETKQPTQRFFEEVTEVMTQEELEKDRDANFSLSGRVAKASVYFRNLSRQELLCCPCHVM